MGQMANWFAEADHNVLLTDISDEMLSHVRSIESDRGKTRIQTAALPLQSLDSLDTDFDLVMCHAVLEWVTEQQLCVEQLVNRVKPGGYLSLMVFNYHGLLLHNLTAGNLDHVAKGMRTRKKKLVPKQPLKLKEVEAWLTECAMQPIALSGVRVFNDYIRDQLDQLTDQQIIDMELVQSKESELIPVSRYLHLVYRKPV